LDEVALFLLQGKIGQVRFRHHAGRRAAAHLDEGEAHVLERVVEDGRFLGGEIVPRFFLDHLELVDEEFARFEVGRDGPSVRGGDASEHIKDVLRLHHHELDEALGQFGVADCGFLFIEFSHGPLN